MDYLKIPIKEQVEVLALNDNFMREEEGYKVHVHAVLGKAEASALGGHILEAQVWPTLEAVVEGSPRHLLRKIDPETGLAMLDLSNQ